MSRPVALATSPTGIAIIASGAAAIAGILIAVRPAAGVAFALSLIFVPLVLSHLPTGLALWAPIPFIQFLPALWIGPTVASLLVLGGWLGVSRPEYRERVRQLGRQRSAMVSLFVLIVWLTTVVAWSSEPARTAGSDLLNWYVAALIVLIFASTPRTGRQVTWIAGAFVLGAVLSVTVGLVSSGLQPAASALDSATVSEGRLQGGSGDPNYLAAGLVPALALTGGLAVMTRGLLVRVALLGAGAIIALGLAATQSRGGLVAAAVAAGVALVVLRGHRLKVLSAVVAVAAVAGVWLVSSPGALARFTTPDGGGTGRTELWTVAVRMAQDHPLLGVGLGDFQDEAPHYVREPGQLEWVEIIAERPHVAHNTYLQALSETGLVGLALLLAVIALLLRATFHAGRRLEQNGDAAMATFARTVLVAQISLLAALVFVSNGTDQRLWLLLGLGTALHAASRGHRAAVRGPATQISS